jgi:hypothetical protein
MVSSNIYTDYVHNDKLISPKNGYTCRVLNRQNIQRFGFNSVADLLTEYPNFPLKCHDTAILRHAKAMLVTQPMEARAKRVEEYSRNPTLCLQCNEIFSYERKNNKFCNNSCVATYSNSRRKHSEETKAKISRSMTESDAAVAERLRRWGPPRNPTPKITRNPTPKIKFIPMDKLLKRLRKYGRASLVKTVRLCNNGKWIHTLRTKAIIGSKTTRYIERTGDVPYLKNHHKKGRSYPELFFAGILKDRNIDFAAEVRAGKYSMDFKIHNINLEIDGEQHYSKSSIIRDNNRNEYMMNIGLSVIRIRWRTYKRLPSDARLIFLNTLIEIILELQSGDKPKLIKL